MSACGVRPSVRLSVTFVSCAKTNKHIFEFLSPSGSQAILVFPCQTGWQYSGGNRPNGGVECRCGIGRNRDSGLIAGCQRLLDMRSAKNSYRRPCSVDRTHQRMFVCDGLQQWTNTAKRTEKNLIVRSGISEAETTNNKKDCAWCYTDTKHRTASLRQQNFLLKPA